MKKLDPGGTAALAAVLLSWASMPVFLRGLTEHVDALTANGLRYPAASILYWPVILLAWRTGKLGRGLFVRALGPAFFSAGGQILWAMAPYHLEASMIGFLIKVSILWAIIGAMLLFPEERALLRSARFYVGLVLALVGFVALAAPGGEAAGDVTPAGLAIILGCAFFFGLYGVSVRQFMDGVPPLLAFGVISQYVSVVTVALLLLFGDPSRIASISARGWTLILVSSMLGIGISHVLFYIALRRLGASLSMASHLTTPFLTLALAQVFLGERMAPSQWAWGSVMVAGGGLLVLAQETVVEGIRARARRRAGGG